MAKKGEREHIMLELESTNDKRRRENRSGRGLDIATSDAEPLYETDVSQKPNERRRPPMAGPEHDLDDDGDDDIPFTPQAHPGVDDGFFITSNRPQSPKPGFDEVSPNGIGPRIGGDDDTEGVTISTNNNNQPQPPVNRNFPYAPDFPPGVIMINGVPTQVPDVNVYQHKKTLAQGMMDLALLSANANQLRYVLESYRRHPYYYASLLFISVSLLFQIAVGIGLILNSRYNVKDQREICKANRINNLTVIGIFIVTIVNVFISAFGVADPPPDMKA